MAIPATHADSVLEPDVNPNAQAQPATPGAPDPNLQKTKASFEARGGIATSLMILSVLATLYTLFFAREFLLPIVFAVLLNFLLGPLVRKLARIHVPPPVGAGIIVLALVGLIGLGTYELSGPIEGWATSAPQTLKASETKLAKLVRPIQRAGRTAEQVANVASATTGSQPKATQVVVQGPSILARAFGTTQRAVASLLEVLILLYFLLAAGDLFLQKLIKVLPNSDGKHKAVQIARETEASISTFLMTTAIVNVCEGAVVAGVMYLWGMPSPILWGALVAVFEFIPYLGALAMVVILSIAAITTYDNIAHALLIPASFLLINLVQGNLVSPFLLGHRLSLNPVVIFVGVAFWFWIWGVPGAFIAVPLLATFKIFCGHIESLAAVGEFLGTRDDEERRQTVRG
jgi:predicted PurR-regulated permease PerM